MLAILIIAIVICGIAFIGDLVALVEGDEGERMLGGGNMIAHAMAILALSLAIATVIK